MAPKISFNPYEVLEIDRGCSDKELQKAYKQQCLRWHPDKNLGNKEEAEKKFIIAKEAFQFLFDKTNRDEYDRDYERAKYREANQRARMEKADSTRRKLIDELHQREKAFAEKRHTDEHLTPAQLHQKRKEEEKRIRSEFELLRQRLEKEAADEVHAQQERLARLAREQAESKTQEKNEEKHATLRVKWRPLEDRDYDEEKLRKIFENYGTISMITPIRTTKKGDRICMIEFDSNHSEYGAELEHGKDGPEISASWLIPPQASKDGGNEGVSTDEKRSDFASMSYEELQAQLFGDMPPPPEKRKKWHEEDEE
ncbi:DnaJ subfamily C member 17 [Trichostrongylus colubriformis]|uniref:DnaJ subfamily C member 17 n=1 Tax=Trichostrongylus colubriformis TaxID=6319 RepID=A0AAN8IGX8_TRICO